MDRRSFLKASASAALLPICPTELLAKSTLRRRRPSDADWPSKAAWQRLNEQVGGNLVPVDFPLTECKANAAGSQCKTLFQDLRNPFYIGDQPGLTQTLGWVNAWTSAPSVYAVAARSASDIAAAINFARKNDLRLVVKGGGHSYQGTSNAPDSLLIWTRHMNDISLHKAFVPQGCTQPAQPAVTLGAGTIWLHAYEAVTTRGGQYVQGGGCTTVGVAGLIQSGGFGSFSKRFGLAAAGLLEAEVVTADGKIRIANSCTNPDLFWALKGGGGGSFGVVSKLTLRLRDLPEYFGGAIFNVKASSDDAYRRLLRYFVSFYHDNLFNDHWGEQAHIKSNNILGISMVFQGLDADQAKRVWQPFLDWVARAPNDYSLERPPFIAALPAKNFWDTAFMNDHYPGVFVPDSRQGSRPGDAWWAGDSGQVGQVLHGYESLWLPASLLESSSQEHLADALFASSRQWGVELHFNKGLAGAPPDAITDAKQTAMNPAVTTAFALAISAGGEGPAYPGVAGHEPDQTAGKEDASEIARCMRELRALAPQGGSYVSESNFFEPGWQSSFWGGNYARLAAIKKKYDPSGLFFVHHGVGSEEWSDDGFRRIASAP